MKSKLTISAAMFCIAKIAFGQGFNLDFDIGFGPAELGNGAPSSSFGAAAGQPGFWNRVAGGAGWVGVTL